MSWLSYVVCLCYVSIYLTKPSDWFQGAGMILSLENSLAEHVRPKFKVYFGRTMVCVTTLYVVFGCSGYISFGPGEFLTVPSGHDWCN